MGAENEDVNMEVEKPNTKIDEKPPQKIDEKAQEAIEKAREMVSKDSSKLNDAIALLLESERIHRLSNDTLETSALCVAIVQLCFEQGDWEALNTNIVLLSKRRAQLKQAVTKVVQAGVEYVESTPSEEIKLELLNKLRTVSEGKLYVELERARITRIIAEIKESKGDVEGACDIMQDMQVETYGTMDRREKTEFILEQVRLCLLKKDYIRAGIMAKKVTAKTLAAKDIEDLILRYYLHLVEIKLQSEDYLEVCRCYLSRYEATSVQADEKLYLQELRLAIFFLVLSKRDPMQSDLLHRIKAYKTLEKLPAYGEILKLFTTEELIRWDHLREGYSAELTSLVTSANFETDPAWETPLQDRTIEHNLRVVSSYYSRLELQRLAELLNLSVGDTEERVTRMVSDEKALWAKIDRPAGIVVFSKPDSVDTVLNDWAANVPKLLEIVERTCHLVHKQNMMNKMN
ncbi:hypothetical protein NDN08_005094 [Rhodosorus marinus]|uniref:PCI domain-containing protein n=1 Tax=Rhodosorus marinus TaxID=101924 RepID=A0AAV8V0J5_9RHOD|nr:hypothetical protein NDN08_005094 [Rhodosorus marinus]